MDREKVITHLQIIHTWAEFARERDLQFFTAKHLEDIAKWADDALNLLKEQEGCVSVPFSWLVKFCTHIDFVEPLTDAEREVAWRKKLWQQFDIIAPERW